jgi:flagellar biogenesis protein FliO
LGTSFNSEKAKWDFTKWSAATGVETNQRGTDLRLFGLGKILIPDDVVTGVAVPAVSDSSVATPGISKGTGAKDTKSVQAATAPGVASGPEVESVDQTKVNAVGKLIKVIFIVIALVVFILMIIYTFYKIGSVNKQPGGDSLEFSDYVETFNSPTAYAIYTVIGLVGIAGIVAFLREKFKATNAKNPEDYVFNDLKPEDSNNPMRQLTFGMTHIIYIVLMVIVLIYDTEKDDKDRMSVTGMTILAVIMILFHYLLEISDNKIPPGPGAPANEKPTMAPMSNLLSNMFHW